MSGFKGVGAGRDGPVHQASNDPPGASWNYRLIEFADQFVWDRAIDAGLAALQLQGGSEQ